MTEIEIDVKAKIFDDQKYCAVHAGDATQYCRFYYKSKCLLFGRDVISKDNNEPEKCQQCKDVYQKVIERQADDYFDKQPVKTTKL